MRITFQTVGRLEIVVTPNNIVIGRIDHEQIVHRVLLQHRTVFLSDNLSLLVSNSNTITTGMQRLEKK